MFALPPRLRWAIALGALALVSIALVACGDDAPEVEDATESVPPLGDCYGGVLSQDPLQCYALEQAERLLLIRVTALYVAPGGGPLYVWLNQTGPASDEVYAFLKTKSYEFYDRWPDVVPPVDTPGPPSCLGSYQACFLDHIHWNKDFLLPTSSVHGHLVFHVGGEKARREYVGWASWRQLWPNPAGARDVSSAFDVSDVDTTNFPECNEDLGCLYSEELAGFGVAGYHSFASPVGSPTRVQAYIQIKDPPQDEADLEALRNNLKERLWACGGRKGPCTFVEDGRTVYMENPFPHELEIVPVKYSFEDLWRWAIVLDRFAHSAGNTVGVTQARVDINFLLPEPDYIVYPLAGLQSVGDGPERNAHLRETIRVDGLDPDLLVAALPTLLPQLGIPVDAVGIVGHDERYDGPGIAHPLDGSSSGGAGGLDEPLGQGGSGDGLPVGAIAGAAGLVAVGALGAVVAWRRRA